MSQKGEDMNNFKEGFIDFVLPVYFSIEIIAIKFLSLLPQSLAPLLNRMPYPSIGICWCSFFNTFHTEGLHLFPANVTLLCKRENEQMGE